MAKGWVMTPARAAYYASKKKKGGGVKLVNKAKTKKLWSRFERVAKREMGASFTGHVTGDMLYGGKLSDKAVKRYRKYFKSIRTKK